MKLISTNSKFLPLLLLVLLLISILLAFGSAHNAFVALGHSTPTLFIVFVALPVFIGLLLYSLFASAKAENAQLHSEVAALKQTLENSLKTEVKETVQEVGETAIDVETTVTEFIPAIDTSNLEKFGEAMFANIAKRVEVAQGLFYHKDPESGVFSFAAGYAFFSETQPVSYIEGDTLPGQVAKNKKVLNLDTVPDDYITILSGLGKSSPRHLLIAPIVTPDAETIGVFELASFKAFNTQHEALFAALGYRLGEVLTANKPISQD
ncbi:MAG: GAF domain-containing protein [Bacteroidales bacterium]|nr:GAF domain-containing protein [Bacteroidales bacterium]